MLIFVGESPKKVLPKCHSSPEAPTTKNFSFPNKIGEKGKTSIQIWTTFPMSITLGKREILFRKSYAHLSYSKVEQETGSVTGEKKFLNWQVCSNFVLSYVCLYILGFRGMHNELFLH